MRRGAARRGGGQFSSSPPRPPQQSSTSRVPFCELDTALVCKFTLVLCMVMHVLGVHGVPGDAEAPAGRSRLGG